MVARLLATRRGTPRFGITARSGPAAGIAATATATLRSRVRRLIRPAVLMPIAGRSTTRRVGGFGVAVAWPPPRSRGGPWGMGSPVGFPGGGTPAAELKILGEEGSRVPGSLAEPLGWGG